MYLKRRNPRLGYPLVGVAVWARTDDSIGIADIWVAATSSTSHPTRLHAVEDELEDATIVTTAGRTADSLDETDFRPDVRVSPAYCSHLLSVYAERALRTALNPSQG